MYAALMEAENAFSEEEVPVGAIIVHKNRIIGKGHNQVEKLKDPTAHAELIAITAACNHLNSPRLNECELYVTMEPCLMCIGAAIHARINKIYFSLFDPKFGACGSIYNIVDENKFNHEIKIYSGLLEQESKNLLTMFFGKLRK